MDSGPWAAGELEEFSGGEQVDQLAGDAIRLAHRALERFPEFVRRHRFVAGGAAVSSALIALAGVAIMRRIRAGQTSDEAVALVTVEEIDAASPTGCAERSASPRTTEYTVRTETIAPRSAVTSDAAADQVPEASRLPGGDGG